MSAMRDAALAYAAQGLAVFPLVPKDKRPLTPRGFLDATTDAVQVRAWWTASPAANIGAVPASVGCIALDIDTPEHEAAAASLGLFAEPNHEVTTGKGRHVWFRYDAPDATALAGIIVRAGRGYVVMPPSVHPSGAVYASETTWTDARPLPEAAAVALAAPLLHSEAPGAPKLPPGGPIAQGGRNVALTQVAGTLAGRFPAHDVATMLHALNAANCQPPLPRDEVQRIADSITAADRRNHPERYTPPVDLSGLTTADHAAPVRSRTIFRPSELMLEPESVPFLVHNVLVKSGLACGWGPSGCGKTFALFDLALHVAAGLPWLGHDVERGDVLYVAAEGYQGLRRRLHAWCAEHALAPADLDGLLAIRRGSWAITDAKACTLVLEEVREHALTPALIVLDTLSANAPAGFNETGTEDMKSLMDAARVLRDSTGATVLFVHHTGLDQSRMRGSTDLYAALDVSLGIKRVGDTARRITFDKARDFPAPEPIEFDLVPSFGSLVVRPANEAHAPRAHDPRHVELLGILHRSGPLAFMQWFRAAEGWTKTPFNKIRAELASSQYVAYDDGRYTLTAAGRAVLADAESVGFTGLGTDDEPEPTDESRFGFPPLSTDSGETKPHPGHAEVDLSRLIAA